MRRTERLFEIIQILRSEARVITAAEIASRLEVSIRTVYRDIQTLQAMRTPIEGAAEIGYMMRQGYDLPALDFSVEEVEAIVVSEIPYQVNKSRLIEKIAALVNDKSIEGIARMRDESDRQGMRIVMELKRDATPEVTMNQLYKMTPMLSSFAYLNVTRPDPSKPNVDGL